MAWELKADRPIYIQIVEILEQRIISGFYTPGGKIPSVRELAAEAGVNPNTMQKALSELERMELVSTYRTSGKVVTDDQEKIVAMREGIAKDETRIYFSKIEKLGFGRQKAVELVNSMAGEQPDNGAKDEEGGAV